MPPVRRVVLLIESSRAYGRGLLRGVAQYAREHGPWSVYTRPHGLGAPPPDWLRGWHGDGMLVRVGDRRTAGVVRRTGLPVVDLRGIVRGTGFPFIGIDNRAVAELAAGHLLERGLRHFGFCGLPRGEHPHMDERCDAFCRHLRAAGHRVSVFRPAGGLRAGWDHDQERLAAWVAGLPRPAGVMTCHDDRGQQVLDACRRAGVRVPDEVAVVSVDDDELLCSLADPPLTSIDVNPARVGYEAAALLDRLMSGQPPPPSPVYLPPRAVVTRASSDVLAVTDPAVAAALRVIQARACRGLRVADVLADVSVSRSSLERRFRAALGRTPKDEITRVQVRAAEQLLETTTLPLAAVATRTGLGDAKYLCAVFRRKVGMTPGAYRAAAGRGAAPVTNG